MFKERFKSLKKCKARRNVSKGKNLELFKEDNWIRARRQTDENRERLHE